MDREYNGPSGQDMTSLRPEGMPHENTANLNSLTKDRELNGMTGVGIITYSLKKYMRENTGSNINSNSYPSAGGNMN